MKILLIRHGKPNLAKTGKIKASELKRWIESYNVAKLDPTCQPSQEAIESVQGYHHVVCSDLSRSIESARFLNLQKIHAIEHDFREVELPYLSFPARITLAPETWAIVFRILWFCGLKANGESFAQAELRASICANKLIKIAKHKGWVLFIGHGFMNRLIAKALLSSGWIGSCNAGKKYWEFGAYEYLPTAHKL